jgi:hypothetical protein
VPTVANSLNPSAFSFVASLSAPYWLARYELRLFITRGAPCVLKPVSCEPCTRYAVRFSPEELLPHPARTLATTTQTASAPADSHVTLVHPRTLAGLRRRQAKRKAHPQRSSLVSGEPSRRGTGWAGRDNPGVRTRRMRDATTNESPDRSNDDA